MGWNLTCTNNLQLQLIAQAVGLKQEALFLNCTICSGFCCSRPHSTT